jgi:hypothetical protein
VYDGRFPQKLMTCPKCDPKVARDRLVERIQEV